MTNQITLTADQLDAARPYEAGRIQEALYGSFGENEAITVGKLKQREFLVRWAWRKLRDESLNEDDLFDTVFGVYHIEKTLAKDDVAVIRSVVRSVQRVYSKYVADTKTLGDLLRAGRVDADYLLTQITMKATS